ncbi:MAG: peptidoglycan-binding domain-containing protein [Gammaproteobacteria bacterium]
MNSKLPLTLAGAVAIALGVAPLALAQNSSYSAPPTMATSTQTSHMAAPTMTSSHAGTMHNKMNMSKSKIMRIQRALKNMGYNLTVDGVWGQGTRKDIMSLQRKNGLKVTGRPDADTMRALGLKGNQGPAKAYLNKQTSSGAMQSNRSGTMPSSSMTMRRAESMQNGMQNKMRSGMNSMRGMHGRLSQMQIKNVQMRLSQKGYQVDQSGKWDSQTRSAIMRFQKKNGLRTTGYPGPKTRRALSITRTMWQSWAGSKNMPSSKGTSMSPPMGTS